MGFPRQESWSGLPFPPPGDLPDPGIEPVSLVPPALTGRFFTIAVRCKQAGAMRQQLQRSSGGWEGGALVRVRPPSPLNRPQPRGGNGSAMAASRKLLSRLGRLRVLAAQSWTPWTVAQQAPLSTGFSRQEYWSGLPFPPPGDLPNPGIKPKSPIPQADSLPSEPPGKPSTPLKAALWPLTIPGIQPL